MAQLKFEQENSNNNRSSLHNFSSQHDFWSHFKILLTSPRIVTCFLLFVTQLILLTPRDLFHSTVNRWLWFRCSSVVLFNIKHDSLSLSLKTFPISNPEKIKTWCSRARALVSHFITHNFSIHFFAISFFFAGDFANNSCARCNNKRQSFFFLFFFSFY